MRNSTTDEEANPNQSSSREGMHASQAAATKFTIEIHNDTATLLERSIEEISDLAISFSDAIAEIFQCLHSLVSEDYNTLLKVSTGILTVNWIVCNTISPFEGIFLEPIRETDMESNVLTNLFFLALDIFDSMFAGQEGNTKDYHRWDATLIAPRDGKIGNVEREINSSYFAFTDFASFGSKVLNYIPPTAMTIVGPLTVITLTCIVADKKYYLFATLFAPVVDRILLVVRSFADTSVPNIRGHQYRTIPDDGEPRDGVLWGMIVLFCLESFLIGSIIVLMVLISLSLTLLASAPTMLSPRENPELLEEVIKILVCFLFLWVASVVLSNILRMALYQTIEGDD